MDDLKRQVEVHGPSRISRKWGVSFEALKPRYEPTEDETGIRAYGRPGMRQYVIAVKKHGAPWPPAYREAIKLARKKYDRGTHEMCQGRTGPWTVLYLIPRLVSAEPRNYFSSMVDAPYVMIEDSGRPNQPGTPSKKIDRVSTHSTHFPVAPG
jgi:hypothetical protein